MFLLRLHLVEQQFAVDQVGDARDDFFLDRRLGNEIVDADTEQFGAPDRIVQAGDGKNRYAGFVRVHFADAGHETDAGHLPFDHDVTDDQVVVGILECIERLVGAGEVVDFQFHFVQVAQHDMRSDRTVFDVQHASADDLLGFLDKTYDPLQQLINSGLAVNFGNAGLECGFTNALVIGRCQQDDRQRFVLRLQAQLLAEFDAIHVGQRQ